MITTPSEITVSQLFEAYYDCRKNKRTTRSALEFEIHLEANLMSLFNDLTTGTWTPMPATVFVVKHPKPREVWAAAFRDRIVHHLVHNAIGPIFERSFIHDSCACLKGRGTLYGADRLQHHLQSATQNWSQPVFVLKADIANFFGSIRHDVLFAMLAKRVTDPTMLDLCRKLVFQDVRKDAVIRSTPRLDWLLLTKRPENIKRFLPDDWGNGYPNVWLGTTVENQEQADERIPALLATPAAIRFISAEPLLELLRLRQIDIGSGVFLDALSGQHHTSVSVQNYDWHGVSAKLPSLPRAFVRGLDWVIVGGESGPNARPMHPDWARSLRDQCFAADVPFLFKQWGEWCPCNDGFPEKANGARIICQDGSAHDGSLVPWPPGTELMFRVGKKAAGRLLDGIEYNGYPGVSK